MLGRMAPSSSLVPVPILIMFKDSDLFNSGELLTLNRTVLINSGPDSNVNGYQQLLSYIRSFPETANFTENDYSICYYDDDDQIPVQSEAEFAEYLKVLKTEDRARALFIYAKGKELPKNKVDACLDNSPRPAQVPQKQELSIMHDVATIDIGSAANNTTVNEDGGQIPDHDRLNSDRTPLWFAREMEKFKDDIMKNMSAHLENFTKELHLSLEKALKEDEPKKLKKSKEKKKGEKKEKPKLLGSSSTCKTVKDQKSTIKMNENMKAAYSMAHPKFFEIDVAKFEKSSSCRDHIMQSQKRMNLNEEKKTKLHSVAKRKKESMSKFDPRSPSIAKEDRALFVFPQEVRNVESPTSSKKKDAERFKTKCSDLSQSSSDSDNRDGQEESDDIVIVGFNSSFDEISDTDFSLANGEEPAGEVPNNRRAVDVELPPCFFPEIPITFKGNVPLQLKPSDIKGLKSSTPKNRVFPSNKKNKSKDKKHSGNAFMVDEKGICHSTKAKKETWKEVEAKFEIMQQSCQNQEEYWKNFETELKGWQVINHSEDTASNQSASEVKPGGEADRISACKVFSQPSDIKLNSQSPEGQKKALSAWQERMKKLREMKARDDSMKEMKARLEKETPDVKAQNLHDVVNSFCTDYWSNRDAYPVPACANEITDSSKTSVDRRNDNGGTKMTVSEMLLSREPPHSDVLKERKRKKEHFGALMDLMRRMKKNTSEDQSETGAKILKSPNPHLTSSLEDELTSNRCTKLEEQFLLKCLNSSDDDSSSDYEECEETGKSSGKINPEMTQESAYTSPSVKEESKTKDVSHKLAKETSIAPTVITVEDPLDKVVSFVTLPSKKNCSQDLGAITKDVGVNWNELQRNKSSTRASQTSNAGLSNESSKTSSSCSSTAFSVSQGVAKESTPAGTDSANLDFTKYFNANKNLIYPPQQIHPAGNTLNSSSSYAFGGASYYPDLLNPNGYPYVPHMPLPKNFSCSQSFQSSQSAQNLIPKPTLAPPPPPIVIPPPIPQDKHFYFHQPGYNALYTNSINPYYTSPQITAFLNKGDPMKNCPVLKRDPTYTTPVMGHMYPSVYPIYYPPSNVPLNTSQNNLTSVVPPAPTPVINFSTSSQQAPEQSSVSGSKNVPQVSRPENSLQTVEVSFHHNPDVNKVTDPLEQTASTSNITKKHGNKTVQQNQSLVFDHATPVSEAPTPSAPCGIEMSSPERIPKPSPRLTITDLIPERLLTTLNSAATNVKEAFASSRADKKDVCGASSSFHLPEVMNAFTKKEPIQVHIITRSSRQRYFVMPHSKLEESCNFHRELRSYMTSDAWRDNNFSQYLQSGDICALHENVELSKEKKDTFCRVKILSVEDTATCPGTLIRAQKIDFGIIVHCDQKYLKELPRKFQTMPPLVVEVTFEDQQRADSSLLPSPLYVQFVEHVPETNHWLVRVCDNVPEETQSDEEFEDGLLYETFGAKGRVPCVPKVLELTKGFLPGSKIILKGAPLKYNPSRFAINLYCGSQEDIALHLNPRLREDVFVRNTRKNGWWGTEERDKPLRFHPGLEFTLLIECQGEGYNILLDKTPLTYFWHRINPESITHLKIEGDVAISELTYATPNDCAAAVPTHDSTLEGTPAAFEDALTDDGGETSILEQSRQEKINFLLDIGFKNEDRMRDLLILNNEDVSDVLDILTSNPEDPDYLFNLPL